MLKRLLGVCLLAATLNGGVALAEEATSPIRLKDDSYVFIDVDGTTRMVDRYGKPMSMKNDMEMETSDGEIIVMKNNRIWKLVGPPGKRKRLPTDG